MNTTDIVFRELTADEVYTGKPFSHFGWEGVDAFAFYRMSDAYWDAAKVLLDKMKSNPNNIEITDGLIYPLFFNYRHSVETYLKALLFEHGAQSKEARQKYINKRHSLEGLWGILKLYLRKGVKHVGSSISLDAVEHYIREIHRFDPNSMVMRYPITLELDPHPQREEEMRLDFIQFADCMEALCDSLRQLNYDISGQIEKEATPQEVAKFLEVYKRYQGEIDQLLLHLKEDVKRKTNEKRDLGDADILLLIQECFERNPERKQDPEGLVRSPKDPLTTDKWLGPPSLPFLKGYEPDMLILLEILYLAGSCINECHYQLTASDAHKLNEFIQLCNQLLESRSLSFGGLIEIWKLNVPHASSYSLEKALSTSTFILNTFNR